MTSRPYRADVDGLRAIAVLAVMLFHGELARMTGGFAGVDVFFVISGYLITDLIATERDAGTFSMARFYARRIRRILPALVLLLVAATIASFAILTPASLEAFGWSVMSTALMVANMYFLSQSGYFAGPADQIPLLHTWSLSVEEQFYLIWPLLLTTLLRLRSGRRTALLTAFGLSLLLSGWTATNAREVGFYVLPTRAWELVIGALAALHLLGRPRSPRIAGTISFAGLVAVLAGFFLFDSDTPFPGVAALVPTCGTVLILIAGEDHSPRINRVLGVPIVRGVGLISYSLYLWHWPLLVLARIYLNRELEGGETAAILGGSVVVSMLSWRFVEQPLRRSAGAPGAVRRALLVGPAALAICVAMGAAAAFLPPLGVGRETEIAAAEAATQRINPRITQCLVTGRSIPSADGCTFGAIAESSLPTVVVWGDSHADHLVPGIEWWAEQDGFVGRQITENACPPLLGVRVSANKNCDAFNDDAVRFIESTPAVRVVILAARWGLYAEKKRESVPYYFALTDLTGEASPPDDSARVLAVALGRTLERLIARGIEVLIVWDTPEFEMSPGHCIAQELKQGRSEARCELASERARQQLASTASIFAAVAAKHRNVSVFSPSEAFCDERSCSAIRNGVVLYRDEDHLNIDGARYLAAEMRRQVGALSAGGTVER